MWVELVRAKWRDPFSSLRRKKFELDQIKESILFPDRFPVKRKPLGAVTQPMEIVKERER